MENAFSIKLKKILSSKNLKPADLSRMTGFSESLISQYVNSKTKPKNDRILIIANALNVSPAYLMGWDNEEFKATDEDLKTVGNIDEEFNDRLLALEPFTNIIDAIDFIKEYNVKFLDDVNINAMTIESVIAMINTILTTTQETIRKERQKRQ